MSLATNYVRVFVGSSSEGLEIARALQEDLESQISCEVARWDSLFDASNFTLEQLLMETKKVDFAVLVATPDDTTISRDEEAPSIRDNVLFELGLFMGSLGRERTYIMTRADAPIKLPTDLNGLTRLTYCERTDGNWLASVNRATNSLCRRVKELGQTDAVVQTSRSAHSEAAMLLQEIDLLLDNAQSQGWDVGKNSRTTLRLKSPDGRVKTLQKRQPSQTRKDLRRFVADLRAHGLRVNSALRVPAEQSPLG